MQYASSEDYAKYCPGGTVPPEEQDAALDAASRDIDGLTFDRIVAAGFDRLTAFQQELVKRAVCEPGGVPVCVRRAAGEPVFLLQHQRRGHAV